jgi:pimeloyl-ACP methyl ester carboxylesterase
MHCGRWLALLLSVGLGGCTAFVARQIEHPGRGNRQQLASFRELLNHAGFQSDTMRMSSGVRIAYRVGQPRAYRLAVKVKEVRNGHSFKLDYHFDFGVPPGKAVQQPARGSIVLLHPWGMEGSALTAWALQFADAGYVVVLPDLRSHGESDDAPVGYGSREAQDMRELVARLRRAGRLPGPLYLLGVSYGGTVAMFTADMLPDVRGVIALEPYASVADVIQRAPASNLFGHRWLARWLTPAQIDKATARASGELGVDLRAVDPGAALSASKVCTSIIRGSNDSLMPADALRALAARSTHAQYVEVPDENHLSLPLRNDILFKPVLAWLGELTAASPRCPEFSLAIPPFQNNRPPSNHPSAAGATASPAAHR